MGLLFFFQKACMWSIMTDFSTILRLESLWNHLNLQGILMINASKILQVGIMRWKSI